MTRYLGIWLGMITMGVLVHPMALLAAEKNEKPAVLIADFEGETYGDGWKTTGEAFGTAPAQGTLTGQMDVSGYAGHGLVNSYLHGDPATGTLTSPEFTIERLYLQFLIGGGMDAENLKIELIIDDKAVRSATGPNDRPGGSEKLELAQWDVQTFIGKKAIIRITDMATGGWGHINIDQIEQTDTRLPQMVQNWWRKIGGEGRYLVFPVKNGAPMRKITLFIDSVEDRKFDIELPEMASQADFWTWIDLAAYPNRRITISIDKIRDDLLGKEAGFTSIVRTDTLPEAETLYQETDRPSFHLTSRRGWNNDPNGMVFYQGKYHLFWQHNPFGWNWGNMHWAHAVSSDMLHWEELGDALTPDAMGPMFSGSAVTDWKNTSGFGSSDNPPMVAAYTAAGDPTVQCIAYSTDGKTLTKWAGNPILSQVTPGNRDPRLLWYASQDGSEGHWVLVLYVERPKDERKEGEPIHAFYFYSSNDLKAWTLESKFYAADMFECPDLFELPILTADGTPAKNTNGKPLTKWVLYGADGHYLLGDFDGKTYTADGGKQSLWYGRVYAAQTFSDTPDGRRIQIGWANGVTFPGMPFNQQMTIPVELSLRQSVDTMDNAAHVRMFATPIRELETLRVVDKSEQRTEFAADEKCVERQNTKADAEEISLCFSDLTDQPIEMVIHDTPLVWDPTKHEIQCGDEANRVTAPLAPVDGKLTLRILVDRGSIEIFANQGVVAMSINTQTANENLLTRIPIRGTATLQQYVSYPLQSVWP